MVNVFTLVVAVSSAVDGREEAGTNYWSPGVRKGTRGLTMLQTCLSFDVVSLFVDYRY